MRKPKKLWPIFLCLFVLILLTVCLFAPRQNKIEVTAALDAEKQTLSVTETLRITNRTGRRQKEWVFNLYPNAYQYETNAPVPSSEKRFAYPDGFSSGSAEIFSVTVGNRAADYALSGTQGTLLRVQPPHPVPIAGSFSVTVTYQVTLPDSRLSFGYSEEDVRLSSVFLLPAVYDRENECFFTDSVSPVGDSVLSEAAAWDVTLTAPEKFVASGFGCTSEGCGVWHFSGENLRDFAVTLSPDYEVLQKETDHILLRVCGKSEASARQLLALAEKILPVYENAFGEYPFPELVIGTSSIYQGSDSFPGMVLLDDLLASGDAGMLEFTLANEIAHQWFSACVGSDPVRHPVQSEALCAFAAMYCFGENYGQESFDSLYEGLIAPALTSTRFAGVNPDQPLSAFTSSAAYEAVVVRKGAAAVQSQREALGDTAFFQALRKYIQQNAFQIALWNPQ